MIDEKIRKFFIKTYDRRWEILFALFMILFVGIFVIGLLIWWYGQAFGPGPDSSLWLTLV